MASPDIQYKYLLITQLTRDTLCVNPVVASVVPPVGEFLEVYEQLSTITDPEEHCLEETYPEMSNELQCHFSVSTRSGNARKSEITVWCNKQRDGQCLLQQLYTTKTQTNLGQTEANKAK